MCKRKQWVESRAGLWLNHPQRSCSSSNSSSPDAWKTKGGNVTDVSSRWYLFAWKRGCLYSAHLLLESSIWFVFCSVERQCCMVLHCITVYKQPPPSLHRQHVRSDIATMEGHARAAHLLNGFDANSAAWKNHRWFSFKLPWARAKLPLASVKNASISSGPAMTEGNGETRVS